MHDTRRVVLHYDDAAKMAGEEGFEPSNGGIKIRCLNQLGDSPARNRILGNYAVLLDSLLAARPRTGNAVLLPGRQRMLAEAFDGPTTPL